MLVQVHRDKAVVPRGVRQGDPAVVLRSPCQQLSLHPCAVLLRGLSLAWISLSERAATCSALLLRGGSSLGKAPVWGFYSGYYSTLRAQ